MKVQDRSRLLESCKTERKRLENIFKKSNITTYSFTSEDGYDRYDAEFKVTDLVSTKEYLVEVKCRNYKSDHFETTVLNKGKVDWLMKTYKNTGKIPIAVIFFTDNKYYVIDLRSVNKTMIKTAWGTKTTAFDDNGPIIEKSLYYIPIDKSKIKNEND